MAFHRDLHPSARDLLIKVAPVSLDEHVLTVLRRAGPFAIPRRVSMGWVKTQKMFAALQAAVRMHTLEAKVPNLCFDYLGWDLKGRAPTAGIA